MKMELEGKITEMSREILISKDDIVSHIYTYIQTYNVHIFVSLLSLNTPIYSLSLSLRFLPPSLSLSVS